MPKINPEKRIYSELLPDSQAFCKLSPPAMLHLFLWTIKCTDRHGGGLADPQDILRKIRAYRNRVTKKEITERHQELQDAGFIQTFRVHPDHPRFWDEEYSFVDYKKEDTGLRQKFDYLGKSWYPGPETAAPPEPDMLETLGALPVKTPEFFLEKPQGLPSNADAPPPIENRGLRLENRGLRLEEREESAPARDPSLPEEKEKEKKEKKEKKEDAQRIYDLFVDRVRHGREGNEPAGLAAIRATLHGKLQLQGGMDRPTPDELIECLTLYAARRDKETDDRSFTTRPEAKNYFNPKGDWYFTDLKAIRAEAYEARQAELEDEPEEKDGDEPELDEGDLHDTPGPGDFYLPLDPPADRTFSKHEFRLARSYLNRAKQSLRKTLAPVDYAQAIAPVVALGAEILGKVDGIPKIYLHLTLPGDRILRNVVRLITENINEMAEQPMEKIEFHRIKEEEEWEDEIDEGDLHDIPEEPKKKETI